MKSTRDKHRFDVSQKPRRHPRDYVAEVQSQAEKLSYVIETYDDSAASLRLTEHRLQEIQRRMAEIRAATVHARGSTENIDSLTSEKGRNRRKQIMTDSSTADQKRAAGAKEPGKSTSSKSGGSLMSFNPLHPSMELPPEQLIRLLGLETKKTRKHKKTRAQSKTTPATDKPRDTRAQAAAPAPASPSHRSRVRSRDDEPQAFGNRFGGLLLPSVLVGVIVGMAVSGYLLWPDSDAGKTPSTKVISTDKQHTPAQAKPQTATIKNEEKPATSTVSRGHPAQAPAETTKSGKVKRRDDAEWHAAIEAERSRLRAEAEQRARQERARIQAARELATPAQDLPATDPAGKIYADPQPIMDSSRAVSADESLPPSIPVEPAPPATTESLDSSPAIDAGARIEQPPVAAELPDAMSQQPVAEPNPEMLLHETEPAVTDGAEQVRPDSDSGVEPPAPTDADGLF